MEKRVGDRFINLRCFYLIAEAQQGTSESESLNFSVAKEKEK